MECNTVIMCVVKPSLPSARIVYFVSYNTHINFKSVKCEIISRARGSQVLDNGRSLPDSTRVSIIMPPHSSQAAASRQPNREAKLNLK